MILLAAGLLLLTGAPTAWWLTRAEPAGQTVASVNAAAAVALGGTPAAAPKRSPADSGPALPPSVAGTASPAPDPVAPSSGAATPAPVTGGAETAAPAPPAPDPAAAAFVPVRIVVPDLSVDTAVVPVGVADGGDLEIPSDVGTVGWYRFGVLPGAPGSAVLTGHVDSADQGAGAFARLGDLVPGAQFAVADETGAEHWFVVLAREQWPKGEAPLDRLFDRTGEPRVVLLTCGGAFDQGALGYTDNIAVTAIPVG